VERQTIALATLAEILIDGTTRVLGRDASFLRARLTIRRRNGTPNWDANIGVAGTAVVAAYLQALEPASHASLNHDSFISDSGY
jgi:hypothetical protein